MLKLKYYMLFLLLVSISLGERKVNHFYGDLLYEVPPKFKKIMDNAVVYEAETGTWPNKEYLESRGIGFGSVLEV